MTGPRDDDATSAVPEETEPDEAERDEAEQGQPAPGTLAREALAGASSCGVLGGVAFLGCFPLVVLVVGVALWLVPLRLMMHWGQSPAIDLLDDLAMAQERHLGTHGSYAPASACPAVVPEDGPVPFPGSCGPPWTDLELDWQELPCRVDLDVPSAGRFEATATCPGQDGQEVWMATESAGPHRVEADR